MNIDPNISFPQPEDITLLPLDNNTLSKCYDPNCNTDVITGDNALTDKYLASFKTCIANNGISDINTTINLVTSNSILCLIKNLANSKSYSYDQQDIYNIYSDNLSEIQKQIKAGISSDALKSMISGEVDTYFTKTKPDNRLKLFLIIGGSIIGLIILIVVIFFLIRKNR